MNIALFPLNVVLFPGSKLTLRIFEPRYLDMVRDCMRSNQGFGVCLLRSGKDVDKSVPMHGVGTYANIVDWDQLDDGLLGIHCLGQQRFNLIELESRPNGLNVGKIGWRRERPCDKPPHVFQPCVDYLWRQSNNDKSPFQLESSEQLQDPQWVSYRLAELLPLTLGSRQTVLEIDDVHLRLKTLMAVIQALDRGRQPS